MLHSYVMELYFPSFEAFLSLIQEEHIVHICLVFFIQIRSFKLYHRRSVYTVILQSVFTNLSLPMKTSGYVDNGASDGLLSVTYRKSFIDINHGHVSNLQPENWENWALIVMSSS